MRVAPDLVGDLPHLREVHATRVGGVAGDEDQRTELAGLLGERVVVEQPGGRVGAVARLLEHLAADVRPEAVREVAAGVERHAEQPLVAELLAQLLPGLLVEVVDRAEAGLLQRRELDALGERGPEGDQVGVDAGVRLHVRVLRAEQLLGVLGGQRLDGVDVAAACVEAAADGALGVLVRQPAAHREQHRRRGVVLAGDELQRRALIRQLLLHRGGDARLDRGDGVERGAEGGARRGGDGEVGGRSHTGSSNRRKPRRTARCHPDHATGRQGRSPVVTHPNTPVTARGQLRPGDDPGTGGVVSWWER